MCKLSMFMSLKLLKLKSKIFFWSLTGKIKKLQSRLQLNFNMGDVENVLIFFPTDESSFRVAYYTFRDLGKTSKKNIKFVFVIKEKFNNLFHLPNGDIILMKDSNKDSILLDEGIILKKLKKYNFDFIIDLNTTFHIGVSRLISSLNSKMKVGFESDFSDIFYNIQLDISKSGIMEKGFKQINWMIIK